MSAHLTEEEQLEALKRWWAENGKSLIFAVVLATAGYFGYNGWQQARQQSAEAASATYEEITELLRQQDLSEEEQSTLVHLAEELKLEHADTLYGVQAALLLAKQAVEKNDLTAAELELRWALERADTDNLKGLVRLRLARVLLAQGRADEALALVKAPVTDAFKALYLELQGDVAEARGDTNTAAISYQAAIDALSPEQSGLTVVLQMKLHNLQAPAVGG